MRKLKIILILVLVVFLFSGCQGKGEKDLKIKTVEFGHHRAVIELSRETPISSVSVFDQDGSLITTVTIGSEVSKQAILFFDWEEARPYLFQINLKNGNMIEKEVKSPAKPTSVAKFCIQAPYGMRESDERSLVAKGSKVTATVFLESYSGNPLQASVKLTLPKEFKLVRTPSIFKAKETREGHILTAECKLVTEFDNFNELLEFEVLSTLAEDIYKIEGEATVEEIINGERKVTQFQKEKELRVISLKEAKNLAHIAGIKVPTNDEGDFDSRKKENTLALSVDGNNFLKRILGTGNKEIDYLEHPLAFATTTVRNENQDNVVFLVTSKVLDPKTKKIAQAFRVPPNKSGGTGVSYAVVSVPGKSEAKATLPIYVNEAEVLGGKYILESEIKIFGTDKAISKKQKEIDVITRNPVPGLITLAAFLITVIGLGYLAICQKAFFKGFKTKWLVIIALFGTATFITVNVPGTLLWDFLHVILGPFSFLITGIFYEIILYALIMSLVVLIPRPGVVTLALGVSFLLGGVVLGNFSPVTLMWKASLIFLLETTLYLFGVTRKNGILTDIGAEKRWRVLATAGIACALADTLSVYINFGTTIFLYRLYYATWYIHTYAVIDGFLYTLVGALVGTRLGFSLRKIIE